MFINFSNHPSINWSEKQIGKAKECGEVIDISFPNVDPLATHEEIDLLAKKFVNKITEKNPTMVMVQGEMTLCFRVIQLLKEHEIKVVCACSTRNTKEIVQNGKTIKTAIFEFVQFREY